MPRRVWRSSRNSNGLSPGQPMWRTYVCPVETRDQGQAEIQIDRPIEYRILQFTYLYRCDFNNCKVATLRRKKSKQNKPTAFLHGASAWPRQTPLRSHSSGLDSVLVSSLTFCVPYDFTIDYLPTLRPSLRANTKSATPLQRSYTQDEVSNATTVRRKPRTDEKHTTFHTRIHYLPRMGFNHRYLDQRRWH